MAQSNYEIVILLASKIRSLSTQHIGHPDFEINVIGLGHFLDFIQSKKITEKVIYISSMTVYSSKNKSPVGEDMSLAPLSTYGLSKKVAEDLIRFSSHNSLISSIILRLPGIYGGNRQEGFIYNTINKIRRGEKVQINTARLGYWEAIHIDDLIETLIQFLSNYQWHEKVETFNFGYGEECDICQTGKFIGDYLGAPDLVEIIDRTGYVQFYMSNEKLKKHAELKSDYYSKLKTYIDSFV